MKEVFGFEVQLGSLGQIPCGLSRFCQDPQAKFANDK